MVALARDWKTGRCVSGTYVLVGSAQGTRRVCFGAAPHTPPDRHIDEYASSTLGSRSDPKRGGAADEHSLAAPHTLHRLGDYLATAHFPLEEQPHRMSLVPFACSTSRPTKVEVLHMLAGGAELIVTRGTCRKLP